MRKKAPDKRHKRIILHGLVVSNSSRQPLTPTHAAKFMHRQMQSTCEKPAAWSICSFHAAVTGTRTPCSAWRLGSQRLAVGVWQLAIGDGLTFRVIGAAGVRWTRLLPVFILRFFSPLKPKTQTPQCSPLGML